MSNEEKVINKEAHEKYLALRENPIFDEGGRFIQTSNPNVSIDPLSTHEKISEQVKVLPKDELPSILAKVKGHKSCISRLETLKSQAFGVQVAVMEDSSQSVVVARVINERAAELITLFGKLYTLKEIHEKVNVEWGYAVTERALRNFRKKHLSKIDEEKTLWRNDISHLRLAHKPSRIEELMELYASAKRKWAVSNSQQDFDNCLKCLKMLNHETAKQEIDISANVIHSFEKTIQPHIASEILGRRSLNDIIVTRVAEQLGVSSLYMMKVLGDSYYSKFTGFGGDGVSVEELSEMVPDSPHNTIYNWTDLDEMDESGEMDSVNFVEYKDAEIIEAPAVPKVDIKAALLAKLASKNEKAKDNLD